MTEFMKSVAALRNDRRGVTAVEYGIMASLIAVALVAAMTTFSTSITGTFAAIKTAMGH